MNYRASCRACGFSEVRCADEEVLQSCPSCRAFASIGYFSVSRDEPESPRPAVDPEPRVKSLSWREVLGAAQEERLLTAERPVNEVLGGGLVADQVVLLAGEPGAGKSTLALQLIPRGITALYVTSEETNAQVAQRADRLEDVQDFELAACGDVEEVELLANDVDADLVVVDSINQLRSRMVAGAAGSPHQVRCCAASLIRHCKSAGRRLLLLGQVTKDGDVAGPENLKHLVDTVLTFSVGEPSDSRWLTSGKNRFGPSGLQGLYVMTEHGLADPTARAQGKTEAAGAV